MVVKVEKEEKQLAEEVKKLLCPNQQELDYK